MRGGGVSEQQRTTIMYKKDMYVYGTDLRKWWVINDYVMVQRNVCNYRVGCYNQKLVNVDGETEDDWH